MFIGTRQRKTTRKGVKCLRRPSADQNGPRIKSGVTEEEGDMDPGSMVRGDELLKEPGFVWPFSVIPVVTITGPERVGDVVD